MAAFDRELQLLAKEIEGKRKRDVLQPIADEALKIVSAEISGDLTQSDFSGWRRGKPIKLEAQSKFLRDNSVIIQPTKGSGGPFTVLNDGRNSTQGPRLRSSSLTPTGRKRSAGSIRRWNGVTRGKGTSEAAVAKIEAAAPRATELGLRRVMSRRFDVT